MNALALPVLVPFIGAAACLAANLSLRARQLVGFAVSHGLLLISAWLLRGQGSGEIATLHFGAWDAGLGIVFVLDMFSALMLALAALAYAATWWLSLASFPAPRGQRLHFQPLLMLVVGGVNWTFLTGDLFNLFVGFEVVLLGSYALMVAPGKAASLREGYRFLLANGVAGTMFLLSAGLIYGAYGTLNLAELSWRVASDGAPGGALFGAMLLVVFGVKAAVFPLFTWLPGAYPSMPMSALPFLTAMLTKVGVYALYRVYPLVFLGAAPAWFQDLLLGLAAATMLLGALAALSQWSMREILSVHIVSQIGYMIFGLALLSPIGLAGGILSIAHNIVVKTGLFVAAAAVVASQGTDRLKELGGLLSRLPLVSAIFFLAAVSLAGLPPFSGFYPKWYMTLEGIGQERWWPTAAAILTGLLTLASMVKIWLYAFWGESDLPAPKKSRRLFGATAVAGCLVAASLLFAAASGPVARYAERAATQLLDAPSYRAAVLGGAAPAEKVEAAGMTRSFALLALAFLAAGALGWFRIEVVLLCYCLLETLAAFATGRAKLRSLPRFAWFLADFAWDIARSNVAMAFDAATSRDWHRVRLVRVPIADLSEREIALLNHRINLSPGTLVCEIDAENGHLVVHDMYGGGGADRGAQLRRPIDILRKGHAKP